MITDVLKVVKGVLEGVSREITAQLVLCIPSGAVKIFYHENPDIILTNIWISEDFKVKELIFNIKFSLSTNNFIEIIFGCIKNQPIASICD